MIYGLLLVDLDHLKMGEGPVFVFDGLSGIEIMLASELTYQICRRENRADLVDFTRKIKIKFLTLGRVWVCNVGLTDFDSGPQNLMQFILVAQRQGFIRPVFKITVVIVWKKIYVTWTICRV